MPRFYVLEKLIVGHFVDADNMQDAIDHVEGLLSHEYDITEDNAVLSVKRIDDNAEWPFDEEDD